eukprot:m.54535 g.54535  ORF g.54535 m.54535 type:complete len:92 (+) comp21925_c0_seq1:2619-2894(+)
MISRRNSPHQRQIMQPHQKNTKDTQTKSKHTFTHTFTYAHIHIRVAHVHMDPSLTHLSVKIHTTSKNNLDFELSPETGRFSVAQNYDSDFI